MLAGLFGDAKTREAAAAQTAERLNAYAGGEESSWTVQAEASRVKIVRNRRGVNHEFVLEKDVLMSAEARKLEQLGAILRGALGAPVQLMIRGKDKGSVNGPVAMVAQVFAEARSGMTIQRYKGLGEMNPEQLWETTLDPSNRSLLQVQVDHADEADGIFTTLMGDVVEPRKDFIVQNALNATNIDA